MGGHLKQVLFFIFRELLKLGKTLMSFQHASLKALLENVTRQEDFLPVEGADVSDVMLNTNHLHSPASLIEAFFNDTLSILGPST